MRIGTIAVGADLIIVLYSLFWREIPLDSTLLLSIFVKEDTGIPSP